MDDKQYKIVKKHLKARDFDSDVWNNKTDYGINIEDSLLDLHTARCVLYRNSNVLTGDSAVKYNKADFVTFTPEEWYGRNICHTGVVTGTGHVIVIQI